MPTELDNFDVVVVPGWNGSGPKHWQTLWEGSHSNFRRIDQVNWSRPTADECIASITDGVARSRQPVIFVAHSLGCLAVAKWAAEGRLPGNVAGAFLVAPPWLPSLQPFPAELEEFRSVPLSALPFRSVLIASDNDAYISIEVARALARVWGATFIDIGAAGHINAESGHGPWPEGEQLLIEAVGSWQRPKGF